MRILFSEGHARVYLILGFGVLSIGSSAIFVRWANAPGPVTSFYRMLIATLLLAWPFYKRNRSKGGLPRRGIWIAMFGGVFFAGDLAFWSSGVVLSGATNPTLLVNTAPLWVGLGALIFLKENLSQKFWIGLFLALIGTGIILGIDSLKNLTLGFGSLFGLFAGIFYGGYFLITQEGRRILDSLSYFWLAVTSSTVILLVVSLVLGQQLWGYSPQTYANFLALGVITQVSGWLAINYVQGYLPATIVSPTILGQPVITALLAVILLGESFTSWQVLGGFAVLTGVIIVHRSRSIPHQRAI